MSSRLRAPTTVKNPLKLSADAGNASTSTTTVRPVRPIATAVKRKATAVPAVSVAPALKRAALATRRPVAAAQSATENIPANVPPQKSVVTKKKRPAWDTKGRLEDMEKLTENLQTKIHDSEKSVDVMRSLLDNSEKRVGELESFRSQLESNLASKLDENREKQQVIEELERKLKTAEESHKTELSSQLAKWTAEKEAIQRDLNSIKVDHELAKSELKAAREESINLRSTISAQASNIVLLESEVRALKAKLTAAEASISEKDSSISEFTKDLTEARAAIKQLEERIRHDEKLRRQLHNSIQELKGNIRVFCRIRPILPSESMEQLELSKMKFPDADEKQICLEQTVESASGMNSVVKSFDFEFDQIFRPETTQSRVFEEISQLVQSACDGYNVCIFAYGQTGSGKTFTMEGPSGSLEKPEMMGMIPRGVLQIYQHTKELQAKGWQYEMEGSYLEIYNETIRDLLGDQQSKKHEIKHLQGTNKTVVTDLVSKPLHSADEVFSLLKTAAQNRRVAETLCNERSSRSHSVFMLKITGKNEVTGESCDGVLNLIDLAGSERLSQSGSTGERLKETQAINKSLSALGDVIAALSSAKENTHIPYRNSKLTYLLQNSLGGNSKTLMFVNLSPLEKHFSETLCSLRFATKVNNCQIGTARRTLN